MKNIRFSKFETRCKFSKIISSFPPSNFKNHCFATLPLKTICHFLIGMLATTMHNSIQFELTFVSTISHNRSVNIPISTNEPTRSILPILHPWEVINFATSEHPIGSISSNDTNHSLWIVEPSCAELLHPAGRRNRCPGLMELNAG